MIRSLDSIQREVHQLGKKIKKADKVEIEIDGIQNTVRLADRFEQLKHKYKGVKQQLVAAQDENHQLTDKL